MPIRHETASHLTGNGTSSEGSRHGPQGTFWTQWEKEEMRKVPLAFAGEQVRRRGEDEDGDRDDRVGKMGANMTTRLLGKGHRVVVYDVKEEAVRGRRSGGCDRSPQLGRGGGKLAAPRAVWVMVPPGNRRTNHRGPGRERLSPGDIVIDGGNSYYKDTMRGPPRSRKRDFNSSTRDQRRRVGASEGYSMMIGGEESAWKALRPISKPWLPRATRAGGGSGRAGRGTTSRWSTTGSSTA